MIYSLTYLSASRIKALESSSTVVPHCFYKDLHNWTVWNEIVRQFQVHVELSSFGCPLEHLIADIFIVDHVNHLNTVLSVFE